MERRKEFKYLVILAATLFILFSNSKFCSAQNDNTPLWTYETGDKVRTVSISDDGKYIVVGGEDNKVYLFSSEDNTPLWTFDAGGDILEVEISSDGSYVVAGGPQLYLFGRSDNTPIWTYDAQVYRCGADISGDGFLIVASFWLDRPSEVCLFTRLDNTPVWRYELQHVPSVAISKNGSKIGVAQSVMGPPQNVAMLYLFENQDNNPVWVYINYSCGGWPTSISDNGSFIGTGDDTTTYLFGEDNNVPLWTYDNTLYSISISGDGSRVITGSSGGVIRLFNSSDNTPVWTYDTEDRVVNSVGSSYDGSYFVAGCDDRKIYCFKDDDNVPVLEYETGDLVLEVAIDDSGSMLVGGSEDHKVYLFALNNPPNKPVSLSPDDNQTSTSVTISAVVTDNDGDQINVFFYDASDNSVIDNVWINSGENARVVWSNLSRGNTYSFFACAVDTSGDWGENSDVQSFYVEKIVSVISVEPDDPTFVEDITVRGTVTYEDGSPATITHATVHDSALGDISVEISGNSFSATYNAPNLVGQTIQVYASGDEWTSNEESYTVRPAGIIPPLYPQAEEEIPPQVEENLEEVEEEETVDVYYLIAIATILLVLVLLKFIWK